jgi:hypothetical protein
MFGEGYIYEDPHYTIFSILLLLMPLSLQVQNPALINTLNLQGNQKVTQPNADAVLFV